MLFTPAQYLAQAVTAPKARALSMLFVQGFKVPPFVVVSEISLESDMSAFVDVIVERIPSALYAVRFAAQYEDTDAVSQAGRYQTRLAVPGIKLSEALLDVIKNSCIKLAQGESFVVIVQAYVAAEVSGVAFTRHPESAMCMRIEYADGSGGVVGGEQFDAIDISPETVLKKMPAYVAELAVQMKRIEQFFNYPQDIEWCYRDGSVFILQSRPITTITKEMWRAFQCIDEQLKGQGVYHYTTAVVGESYHNPKPLNYSLLCELYAEDGPVHLAYQRLSITYRPTEHFIQMGNQVFIDKAKEVRALLPSYRLCLEGEYKMSYTPLKELVTTAKNRVLLEKELPSGVVAQVVTELVLLLRTPMPPAPSLVQSLQKVKKDFELIFLINYIAQKYQGVEVGGDIADAAIEVQRLVKSGVPDLMAGVTTGNSLSLDDVSVFSLGSHAEKKESSFIDTIRELGRWQSVRLAHAVRQALERDNRNSKGLISFATFSEVLSGRYDEVALINRRTTFEQQQLLKFPHEIQSHRKGKKESFDVLSEGEVEGLLVTTSEVLMCEGRPILYAETFSPDLVEYFSRVAGVVVSRGGMLSHAAIVARECGLPVIRWSGDPGSCLGKKVSLSQRGVEVLP